MTLVQSTTHDFTASPLAYYGVRGEAEAALLVEKIDLDHKRGLILLTERNYEIAAVLDFAVRTERIMNLRKKYEDEAERHEADRKARIAERKARKFLPLSA